jgi:hypothetical protein
MRRTPRLAAVLVILVFALVPPGEARAADPVNAGASVDRASISVGDRIQLSVIADAEVGYIVSEPTIARQIGSFEVVTTQAGQKSTRGSLVRWTYRYSITAWTLGDLVLPSIAVPYIGPDGAAGAAQTAEVPIKVTSVVAPGEDTSDIKPIKPQLDIPEAAWVKVGRIALGLAAAVAIAGLAALVFWLLLRRRAVLAQLRLTPVQRALRELDELAELRLPEQGKTAEHYARLTAGLRRYAVERYGVQPGGTSREMREALELAGVERMQAAAIYEILREGDEVRFRHTTPYPAHALNTVKSALDVIRRAASAEEYETAALQTE